MADLILASTSIYRAKQLQKLGLAFTQKKPLCEEEDFKNIFLKQNLNPQSIAESLAYEKALSLFKQQTAAHIIGADQLAEIDGQILGKPHSKEKAFEQLSKLNNKKHRLITAICLITPKQVYKKTVITELLMKNLSPTEIKNYINLDNPIDCAGSYKIEEHGIGLFSQISTEDFTSIEGLPMIWLSSQLKDIGYELFSN